MTASVLPPTSAMSLHHTTPEIDTLRGEMPEGTTLEQIIAFICTANLTLTLIGASFLANMHIAIQQMQEQMHDRQDVVTASAWTSRVLSVVTAVGTGSSGFGGMLAPMLQGIHNGITPDTVKGIAEGFATISNGCKEAAKSVSDSDIAQMDAERNIKESVHMRESQNANSQMEQAIQTNIQNLTSLFATKSKGG